MKCKYKYCKFGGEVDKKDAIKINKSYYHKECYKEKEFKNIIIDTYYKKYNNGEPIQIVRKAINRYINTNNYNPKYVLFVLNQNVKLNSINGLIYYLKNNDFKIKYKKEKYKLTKINIENIEIEKSNCFKFKQKSKKQWGDILCK